MVQNSHCWGDTGITGLVAPISRFPQQQLLRAASHLQHQGADWAPDSHTSLKSQGESVLLEFSSGPSTTSQTYVGAALSPLSQANVKGSTNTATLLISATNQPKRSNDETKHSQQVHFKVNGPLEFWWNHLTTPPLQLWPGIDVKDGPSSRHRTENQSNSAHLIRMGSCISPSATNSFIPWAWQHYHPFNNPQSQLRTHRQE